MNRNKPSGSKKDSFLQHPYIRRFIAFLIDWYVSSFFALIPTVIFQSINGKDLVLINRIDTLNSMQAVTATLLALFIYIYYFCVFPLSPLSGFKIGQTPGRRLLGISLVKIDSSRLTFKDLFIRDFIGVLLLQGNITSVNIYLMALVEMFSGSAAFVPYLQLAYYLLVAVSLVMVFMKRKQMLHDFISQTRMITVDFFNQPYGIKAD